MVLGRIGINPTLNTYLSLSCPTLPGYLTYPTHRGENTLLSLFLYRYCTLTMMAGVGVAHKLFKTNKKKITIQIFAEATSVKTIYKQSSGTGIPSNVPAQP